SHDADLAVEHAARADLAKSQVQAAAFAALVQDADVPKLLGIIEQIVIGARLKARAVADEPLIAGTEQSQILSEVVPLGAGKIRAFQIQRHPVFDAKPLGRA